MKRDAIDFHQVEPHHRAIDARLANWARWCFGRGASGVQPMFRLYRAEARAREQYGAATVMSVDTHDAALMSKAVSALPDKHRAAIQWCYVKPISPARMARALGVSVDGLHKLLRDARQMLVNRGY